MIFLKFYYTLASWPPPAANARPSGLKRHSRGEDAFKEGRCIQGGIRRHSRGINTDKKTYYVLYNIEKVFIREKNFDRR